MLYSLLCDKNTSQSAPCRGPPHQGQTKASAPLCKPQSTPEYFGSSSPCPYRAQGTQPRQPPEPPLLPTPHTAASPPQPAPSPHSSAATCPHSRAQQPPTAPPSDPPQRAPLPRCRGLPDAGPRCRALTGSPPAHKRGELLNGLLPLPHSRHGTAPPYPDQRAPRNNRPLRHVLQGPGRHNPPRPLSDSAASPFSFTHYTQALSTPDPKPGSHPPPLPTF